MFLETRMEDFKNKVLGLFLMRFRLSPIDSLSITEQWLKAHPNSTWETLYNSLKNSVVAVQNKKLIDLYDQKVIDLVNQMRASGGLDIKNRTYRLQNYPLCFVGKEAVEWMRSKYSISTPEAIKLGQKLIDEKIIHHVADDHEFKNAELFFRFYIDE